MGVVAPLPGFNAALAEVARVHGSLLVLTRCSPASPRSPSGWWGSRASTADLFTFGKVMSGGLPARRSAGARRDGPPRTAGPVYQAARCRETRSRSPPARPARALHRRRVRHDRQDAGRVAALVTETLTETGVAHGSTAAGNLFSVFFTAEPVVDYASARRQDNRPRTGVLPRDAAEAGVHLPPSAYEAWFVSRRTTIAPLEQIAAALPGAARAAAAHG